MQSLKIPQFFLLVLFLSCNAETAEQTTAPASKSQGVELDVSTLENILASQLTQSDGQYKITVPQNELEVTVDGFEIVPPMGLTSWATFAPASEGVIVMGDLVLQEDEIADVEMKIVESGLTVSALHNHFVRDIPKAMFMHIHGTGDLTTTAQAVRDVFDRIEELRREKGLQGGTQKSVESTFSPDAVDSILGYGGEMNAGVYKVTIPRPDVELLDHGTPVTSFMGFNTWMAFQGTPERAAVAGDFAMLEEEVAPVIEALVESDIEVVALHNHMVTEEPRIFFLHFWGVGSVESLATGLRAGLDATGLSISQDR